jgi:hypothetical protein
MRGALPPAHPPKPNPSPRIPGSCGRRVGCGCRGRTETAVPWGDAIGPALAGGACEPCVMPDVNEPKARAAPAPYASGRTFEAWGPLGPSVISNSTA